ncbi:MAG: CpsD/CapB family tyrosine-protein kinase [Panacagrimonas sp.]
MKKKRTPTLSEDMRAGQTDRRLGELLSNQDAFDLYRSIDNELFSIMGDVPKNLAVVSAAKGEGRSTLAVTLASFAAAYCSPKRVLLVEAVLGVGELAARMSLAPGKEGFNSFNLSGERWKEMVLATPIPGLDLLAAGEWSWRHAKLSQNHYSRLLREAAQEYQWVIVDTPAGGRNNDVIPMASLADAALLVVGYGGASREQVQAFVERLRQARTRVLGGVLNRLRFPVPRIFGGGPAR